MTDEERKAISNAPTQEACDAFLDKRAEALELLHSITAEVDGHCGLNPDAVHWGNVGDLARVVELLTEAAQVCGLLVVEG